MTYTHFGYAPVQTMEMGYQMMPTTEVKKPKKMHPCMFKTFKRNRNYQCEQQAILLLLLNETFDITVKKPQKTKCESQPFFKILQIVNGEDEIEVNELVERRCNEIAMRDVQNGINEKTAVRRKIVNRNVEVLHLLNDILTLKGAVFESKMTTGNHGVVKETIVSLRFGDWNLTKDQISSLGRQLNVYISDMIKQEKGVVVLKKEDAILSKYFSKIVQEN